MFHERYFTTVYGLHLAGLIGRGGHLVMERQTVRRCQAALPPAVLQMSGLESHLAHRKHKQGLPSSPEFRGDAHRPCLMPAGESVSALLPVPQAGHETGQTQYQHQ